MIKLQKKGYDSMKKVTSIALLLCLLVSLLAGCGGTGGTGGGGTGTPDSSGTSAPSEPGGELPTLRVAVMPLITSLPVKYVMENKLDEARGFRIEPLMFSTGAPMNEALGAGLWDISTIGVAAVTSVSAYGGVLVGDLLEASDGIALYARADSPIAQVSGANPDYPELLGDADTVRGASFILDIGTIKHLNELKYLEALGLDDTAVSTINMDTSQGYQAFLAGEGDIVGLMPPFSFMAVDNGWVNVGGLKQLGIPVVDMMIANAASLADEETSALIVKFLDAVYEANEALNNDPEMTKALLAQYYTENASEVDEENIAQDVGRVHFLTKDDMRQRQNGEFLKVMADFMHGTGKVEDSKLPLFETNITDQYLAQVLEP